MHKMEVVLAILDSNGGAIGNRTVLMKLGYFAALKAGMGGIRYKDYFYGPFSKELAHGIEDARAALLVDETVRSSPIESYAYSLTDDGREIAKRVRREHPEECAAIDEVVAVCREHGGLLAHPLAFAAKAHYRLARAGGGADRTRAGIEGMEGGFGWNLKESDVKHGASLLYALGLPGCMRLHDAAE